MDTAAQPFAPARRNARTLPAVSPRAAAASLAFLATLAIAALNEHAPLDVTAGPPARLIAAAVPLLAAFLAALAVVRPWRGFVAVVATTPVVNVAQMSWGVAGGQVIFQTVFVLALATGMVLDWLAWVPRVRELRAVRRPTLPAWTRTKATVPVVAAVAFVGLAGLSTVRSPSFGSSFDVLLHGILEPMAMGLILLWLRPGRARLTVLAVALGLSVGIGGLLDMVQSLPGSTLAHLQADRLLFSRVTYFNVGLFAEMVAMAVPLLAAVLLGRRRLGIRPPVVMAVSIALAVGLVSLFFTFSKSGYLSAAAGLLVLLLLAVQTWRQRAVVLVAAALASSLVMPWPELVLGATPPLAQAYRAAIVRIVGQSRFDSWNPATLSGQGSLVERFYATRAAFEMAIDNPGLGIGLDQFGSEYVDTYKPPQAALDLDSAHSMWAEVSAELGFPALFMLLTLYGSAVVAVWLAYRQAPGRATRVLAAGWIGAMAAWFVVATAFAGDMYRPWRNMASDFVMMAIVIGGAFALYRTVARVRPAPPEIRAI